MNFKEVTCNAGHFFWRILQNMGDFRNRYWYYLKRCYTAIKDSI